MEESSRKTIKEYTGEALAGGHTQIFPSHRLACLFLRNLRDRPVSFEVCAISARPCDKRLLFSIQMANTQLCGSVTLLFVIR